MNLHEYQAKGLFADYGLPVSPGIVADTADAAVAAAEEIGGDRWAVKVQVTRRAAGARPAGSRWPIHPDEVRAFAERWIGGSLVTAQTDAGGQPVSRIYVEQCVGIERELYLGAVIDRGSRRIVFMASTEGGVEIEKVAQENSRKKSCGKPSTRTSVPSRTKAGRSLSALGSQVLRSGNFPIFSCGWQSFFRSWIVRWSRSIRWLSPRTARCTASMRR